MQKWLSPLCLVLALTNAVAGFAIWSVEPPQESVELHAARVSGDEGYEEALESQLSRQRWRRKLLIGGLFGGSILLVIAAFATLK